MLEDSKALEDLLKTQLSLHSRSEKVSVIRQAMELINKDDLIRLMESCGLAHDTRHFAADSHRLEHKDWWEISYQPNDSANAYTHSKTRQPLHCDNVWFRDPPELNLFVMVKQAAVGGEQVLYPASSLINDLKNSQPGLLRSLLDTSVVIRKGDEPNVWNETPILKLETQPKIFWNYYRIQKDNQRIVDMCESFFQFLEGRMLSGDLPQIRLSDGDLLFFNDQHFLHGRTAFEAFEASERVLLQSIWKLPAPAISKLNS